MTDLVRTVPTGSVGLDLVLGGGPRLLCRMAGSSSESATMLVRGGPGTGKSVLATDLALRLARAIGSDVLYVCVEILPSEVIAQRMGFDGFDPTQAIDLAQQDARKASGDNPTLVVGMTEMEMGSTEGGEIPDLGRLILDLARVSVERGFDPRVVVVDSLSDGYRLGAGVPRALADGVCKLAVEQAWVLVLVEEAVDERASAWSFAVDTVLSLEVTRSGRRELRVTKHRFGPCQPGPHRLLVERKGVHVLPCFDAYRNAARDLALVPPATNRSLRVPVTGQAPDWTNFNVPDRRGRVVAVKASVLQKGDALDNFTATIGSIAQGGSHQPGGWATLFLAESEEVPLDSDSTRFVVGTLHPMIDGEEWLEAALSHLAAIKSPIARLRIGPTERLAIYAQRDTLRKAVSLLAAILGSRGFVVVVFGRDLENVIRAGIVDETWTVSPVPNQPAGRFTIEREVGNDKTVFETAMS